MLSHYTRAQLTEDECFLLYLISVTTSWFVWFMIFTAVNVFIGCVEFLEKPAMAFVRLNESVLLESILEVPVPIRFIFVLLGPTQTNVDYHEIGRSFSTLMSDKVNMPPL